MGEYEISFFYKYYIDKGHSLKDLYSLSESEYAFMLEHAILKTKGGNNGY